MAQRFTAAMARLLPVPEPLRPQGGGRGTSLHPLRLVPLAAENVSELSAREVRSFAVAAFLRRFATLLQRLWLLSNSPLIFL